MIQSRQLTLNDKILLAAITCSGGSVVKTFTAEDLLVVTWLTNKHAFGLRGFEEKYPDSNKLYTKIDGKDSLVDKGFFDKVGERTLRLTEKGLAYACELQPTNADLQIKLNRQLQQEVNRILSHSEFRAWLSDSTKPKHFRGAGYFWRIAAGTPPKAVKERINSVENTLKAALDQIDKIKTDFIAEEHGKILFERKDIERCLQFNDMLKQRFEKELKILQYFSD